MTVLTQSLSITTCVQKSMEDQAMEENKLYNIEEIYKTTHYKSLCKGKELYFEIEASQLKPLNKTKVLSYDGIEAAEMPEGLVKELLEAIEEIEDLGNAKHL